MSVFQQPGNPWFPAAGAPPSEFPLGRWLTNRKLISAAYVTSRRDRYFLRGGRWYAIAINWNLGPQQTLEFQGITPGSFAALEITGTSLNPAGAQALLYDPDRHRQFVDQALSYDSLCGTAKNPFILKHHYTFGPRTPILAKVTNLATVFNRGQIVIHGVVISGKPGIDSPPLGHDPLPGDTGPQQFQEPPWVKPPNGAEPFDWQGAIPLPAIGATASIVNDPANAPGVFGFTVPQGRAGVIKWIANKGLGVAGTGGIPNWNNGDGNLIFQILINGSPVKNYDKILMVLAPTEAPRQIGGIRLREADNVQLTIFNNPNGPTQGVPPSGQLVGGTLSGWYYPKELEPDTPF